MKPFVTEYRQKRESKLVSKRALLTSSMTNLAAPKPESDGNEPDVFDMCNPLFKTRGGKVAGVVAATTPAVEEQEGQNIRGGGSIKVFKWSGSSSTNSITCYLSSVRLSVMFFLILE